jgi:soluble lytic murein transglycosylase-like protein
LAYYKKVPPILAKEISKVTLQEAEKHNVSFHVIVAVMEVESNFDPFSVSKLKNDPARGLMQVRYNVWKDVLGIKSAYDLHSITGGIDAGTRVLRTYLDQTENDLEKTLYKYVGKNKEYVRLVYSKIGKFTAFVSSN